MSGTQESDCLWQCRLPWGYHLSPEMPTAMGTAPATGELQPYASGAHPQRPPRLHTPRPPSTVPGPASGSAMPHCSPPSLPACPSIPAHVGFAPGTTCCQHLAPPCLWPPGHTPGPTQGLQWLWALLREMVTGLKLEGNHQAHHPSWNLAGGRPPELPPQAPPPPGPAQLLIPTNPVPAHRAKTEAAPLGTMGGTEHLALWGRGLWTKAAGAHSRQNLHGAGTAQGPRLPPDTEEGAAGVPPGLPLPLGG